MPDRSKYYTINPSLTVIDDDGKYYPDIFTFPISQFRAENVVLNHTLTRNEVYRFDQFLLNWYGKVAFYKEMILWLNGIFLLGEDHIGSVIKMYSKIDLDKFLIEHLRTD